MTRIFIFLSLLVLITVCNAKPSGKSTWKCDEPDKAKIDTIMAKIMTYGRPDRKFAENKEEMKTYCKQQSDLMAKLEDYKEKCLNGQPKQVVSVIVYSIKGLFNSYCKNVNTKKTVDLIESASCANKATKGYKTCNDDFVHLLYGGLAAKDSKTRLAQMCCGYIEIFKCIERKAKDVKGCSETDIEAHKQFIHGFFDNAVSILCNEYNESTDKCDSFKFVQAATGRKQRDPVESYFHPLVETLANL